MKRSKFLKMVGAAVALPASLPAVGGSEFKRSKISGANSRGNCILIPSETPGPFPLDLEENEFFFRQDITEGVPGVRLRQRVRIISVDNCEPMANVRVNIWHCDRDGNYSGYGTEAGLTYCRGYQFTDANGECEFVTIVPGWYPGRVTHVHFQVYVSTQYSAVSQWTWPHDAVVSAVASHPELYPEGPDPLTPEQDGVFANGYELQLADLEWDAEAGEYTSFFEATVEGSGTTGLGHQERQTAAVMDLGQNFPNPTSTQTTIPFVLHQSGQVTLTFWSSDGQCVYRKDWPHLGSGQHDVLVNFDQLGLMPASYVYQLACVASNSGERYVAVRRMTAFSR